VRRYDPWAGVWLTREPLPGDAWRPRTWHRYAYAFASPISYYDAYGLAVTPEDGGGPAVPALTPPPPTPTPMPAPQRPPTPPYTPTPTGATTCVQPLPAALQRYAQSAAREFGLPPEFVAAVLWAQQRYDYSLQDVLEDWLALSALKMIEAQESLPFWARGLNPYADQGWLILGVIERIDLSLGVGQIRISSAREAAQTAVELGLEGYDPAISTRELIRQLEDPEWNVRYMAGYLRRLADQRAEWIGTSELAFTVQEMQILYGVYRVGPKVEVAPDTKAYQLKEPGSLGSLLAPACVEYYRQLLQGR